jgi:hypothetical protein
MAMLVHLVGQPFARADLCLEDRSSSFSALKTKICEGVQAATGAVEMLAK